MIFLLITDARKPLRVTELTQDEYDASDTGVLTIVRIDDAGEMEFYEDAGWQLVPWVLVRGREYTEGMED